MSLWSEFLNNNEFRMHKSTHYFPVYERHLSRFRNLDITLFEIGVWHGGSLKLWKKYFGPYAKIVGIDIEAKSVGVEEDQIFVRVGDQGDGTFLDTVIAEFGIPDIVIDDGSHQMRHMNFTFDHIYPRQPKNSIYVVEDTFFSYWQESGVGSGECESFIERTKGMIDLLHAPYTRGKISENQFAQSTRAIHVYDGIVVFEKAGKTKRIESSGSEQLFGENLGDNSDFADQVTRWIYGC